MTTKPRTARATETAVNNRRTALASLAAAGALLVAPKMARGAAPNTDAHLLDIEQRLAAAADRLAPLDQALQAATDAIRHEIGFEPLRPVLHSKSRRHIRRAEREYMAAVEAWKQAQADAEARHDLAALTRAHGEAWEQLARIEREVWETPAWTVEGLRSKGRMARLRPQFAYLILADVGGNPWLPAPT